MPTPRYIRGTSGAGLTFLAQHWLGAEAMPRRYADHLPRDGFTTLNMASSIGAFVLGASTLPFLWNVFRSYRYAKIITIDGPWGYGNSLEWATSCPPPRHNFTERPGSTPSDRPSKLHYPHMMERIRAEAHVGAGGHAAVPSEQATYMVEQGDTAFRPARQVSKPLTDHPAGAFQRLFRDNRGFVFATP